MDQLRDKEDTTRGQLIKNGKQITVHDHLVQIDSRDIIGQGSLSNAQTAFKLMGGRYQASGHIIKTSPMLSYPTKIGTNMITIDTLKNGDIITITGAMGNTRINGIWKISNVLIPDPDPDYECSFEIDVTSNRTYIGEGMWTRLPDSNAPMVSQFDHTLVGNWMQIQLEQIKAIRSISLVWASIPRDFIPIETYITDLYTRNHDVQGITYIQQDPLLMKEQSYGFYSTPLSLWRNYNGVLSLPNPVTPPPLTLWPTHTGQPLSYPFQTVPTFVNSTQLIICSGYGVYDLRDWTDPTSRDRTELARKLLLLLIVMPQMNNGVDFVHVIEQCETTSSNNVGEYFGFGQFQRFLPGPGVGQTYQPNTQNPATMELTTYFPNFLGNVWGPYDIPGDRFQRIGLRDTIQDLFLNGDLQNLKGDSPILPDVLITNFMSHPTFGLNFSYIQDVTIANVGESTNPNIINAMRVVPNGFGAMSATVAPGGTYNVQRFEQAGGMGPSTMGTNGAWSATGVYGDPPTLSNPTAAGPNSSTASLIGGTVPQISQSSTANQSTTICHRIGWYTLPIGGFKHQVKMYKNYIITQVPDTNLIIHIAEARREERVQSTNGRVGDSIFNVPIRLNLSTITGNFEYIEGVYGLISESNYWRKRFLSPKVNLEQLNLYFSDYNGVPIPVERMLQPTRESRLLEILSQFPDLQIAEFMNLQLQLNPRMNGRTKRVLSLFFKVESYAYVNAGIDLQDQIEDILTATQRPTNGTDTFMVRASNSDYS